MLVRNARFSLPPQPGLFPSPTAAVPGAVHLTDLLTLGYQSHVICRSGAWYEDGEWLML